MRFVAERQVTDHIADYDGRTHQRPVSVVVLVVQETLFYDSATSASGRLPEITNGCFVEAKHENVVAERRTASEKLDRRVWVDSTHWISVCIAAIGKRRRDHTKAKSHPEGWPDAFLTGGPAGT